MSLSLAACLFLAPQAPVQALPFSGSGTPFNHRGVNVVVDGDRLAMTNGGTEPESARVDLWTRVGGSWVFETALQAPATELSFLPAFGDGLALSGDLLVVGAPQVNDPSQPGTDHGRAFVFRRLGETWSYEAAIPSPAPTLSPGFGGEVAIDGDRVLIGSFGRIDVYRDQGGTLQVIQTLASPAASDLAFGFGFDAQAGRLLATGHTPFPNTTRWAWLFAWDGAQYALSDEVEIALDPFSTASPATACDLEGQRAALCATGSDSGVWVIGEDGGAWSLIERLPAPSPIGPGASANEFGRDVALGAGRLAVSAPDWYSEDGRVVLYRDDFDEFGAYAMSDAPDVGGHVGWELDVEGSVLYATVEAMPSIPNGGVVAYELIAPACSISSDVSGIPASTGGAQTVTYDSCGEHAHLDWFLLGTIGTQQVHTLGFDLFPYELNDPYFKQRNTKLLLLPGASGAADAAGVAIGSVQLPALEPSAVGLSPQHGFLFVDFQAPPWELLVGTSPAEPVTITP